MEPPVRQRLERPDTPEVAALRRLKAAQPQLASAVDMQIELVALYRRAQIRVTTRVFDLDAEALARTLAAGIPIVRFSDVPFDWPELRGLVRQMSDLLRRFDLIEPSEHDALQARVRAGHPTPDEVADWYNLRATQGNVDSDNSGASSTQAQVLSLASRPFLGRAVEMIQRRVDLSAWARAYCPFCGGDPELGVIGAADQRRLVCGRCAGQWPFEDGVCPYCDSRDRGRITSFEFACWPDAARDGVYRLTGCDVCHRYLKSYVPRASSRPVMLDVDTIGSLLLDAAAAQRGYIS
ncbi:MAG: formate dehydrogenase accessory protein FdhE [Acidobacteria bacterium]|nr:formate dehydrogenase accessory protein FdhE [Acidobacteriota bacterium]